MTYGQLKKKPSAVMASQGKKFKEILSENFPIEYSWNAFQKVRYSETLLTWNAGGHKLVSVMS